LLNIDFSKNAIKGTVPGDFRYGIVLRSKLNSGSKNVRMFCTVNMSKSAFISSMSSPSLPPPLLCWFLPPPPKPGASEFQCPAGPLSSIHLYKGRDSRGGGGGGGVHHRVDRVSGFLYRRPNWLPPPSQPQASVAPPPRNQRGGNTRWEVSGRGEPIRTKGQTHWYSIGKV
jgi:hypothetical protein